MAKKKPFSLVGKTIVDVRTMVDAELDDEGWDCLSECSVLVLDDGTRLYASQDEEGNGPGEMFVRTVDNKFFMVGL